MERLAGPLDPAQLQEIWHELDLETRRSLQILSAFFVPVALDNVERCLTGLHRVFCFRDVPRSSLWRAQIAMSTKGLLGNHNWGLVCHPHLRAIALRTLAEEGSLEAVAAEVRQQAPDLDSSAQRRTTYLSTSVTDLERDDRKIRDARLAIALGEWDKVPPLINRLLEERDPTRSQHKHPFWRLFRRTLDPASIDHAPRPLASRIVVNLLRLSTRTHEPVDDLLDWAEAALASGEELPDAARLRAATVQRLLLSGQTARARALVSANRRGFRDTTRDSRQRRDLEALLAFVEGHDDKLLALFDEGWLELLHAPDRKISASMTSYLTALAVLRSRDTQRLSHLQALLATVRHASAEFALLHLATSRRMGHDVDLAPHPPLGQRPPLATLLEDLHLAWKGGRVTSSEIARLDQRRTHFQQVRFGWLADEYACLLERVTGDGTWLAHMSRPASVPPLADIVPVPAPWIHQLGELEEVTKGKDLLPAPGAERIAWDIRVEADETVHVRARTQTMGRNGAWTSGRKTELATVFHWLRQDRSPLAPPDRRALEASYLSSGLDPFSPRAKEALVAHLAGHPEVYWDGAAGERVEIIPSRPTVRLIQREAHLKLVLEPDPPPTGRRFRFQRDGSRLRVCEFTPRDRLLADAISAGVMVPVEGRERLLQVVSRISDDLPVHSDVGLGNVEQVDADATIHLQLSPLAHGLTVLARVRPLDGDGPAFVPGRGPGSVVAERSGSRVQAMRDLQAERSRLATLVTECPTLLECEADDVEGRWTLPETEACLSFLSELEGRTDVIVEWPQGQRFRVQSGRFQGAAHASAQADWFAVDADYTLDDGRVLSLRQLLELTEATRGRFVPLGDGAFLALTAEFRKRLDDVARFSEGADRGVRFHRLAAAAMDESLAGLELDQGGRPWGEFLARMKAPALASVPNALQADLRDYQADGFRWLALLADLGLGACLADDMGLGKTVQALALLLKRAQGGPALIVAPTSVCSNWLDEARRFAPSLKMRLYAGADRAGLLDGLGALDTVVTSYTLLQQDVDTLSAHTWHTIVLDEAQAIKNYQTQRSKAAMALRGDFRLLTTGTPVENHLLELWNLFGFITPGLLGSRARFVERFSNPIEREGDRGARSRLKRLIQPFILRRTKSQVLDELPARTDITIHVEMGDEERALYEALRQRALESLSGQDVESGQGRIRILAELTRLRRACCHPRLVLPETPMTSSRLEALAEIIGELGENHHRALVFSQFVDHLSLVREYLDGAGISYQYLDGSTPMIERSRRVAAFQAGEGDLFLISLKAGGTGLNLTAADYVIHLDPWWNPAVEDQASDRAHRIGQQRPVTVYRLVARGTVEDKIVALHAHKRDLADSLLEGSDQAAHLSGEDLLDLLREGE